MERSPAGVVKYQLTEAEMAEADAAYVSPLALVSSLSTLEQRIIDEYRNQTELPSTHRLSEREVELIHEYRSGDVPVDVEKLR